MQEAKRITKLILITLWEYKGLVIAFAILNI